MTDSLDARFGSVDVACLLPAARDVSVEHDRRGRLLAETGLGAGVRVVVAEDAEGRTFCAPVVDGLRRATAGEGASVALVGALERGGRLESGFSLTSWHTRRCAGEVPVTADQTNESVIVGDRAVVKWAIEVPPGPHPARDRVRTLAEHGFEGMPRPWGVLEWQPDPGRPPRLLATVVEYVPRARDGWEWAVEEVRTALQTDSESSFVHGTSCDLGRLVAEMHVGLATAGRSTMTRQRAERWTADAIAELDEAIGLTGGPEGVRLTARAEELRTWLGRLTTAVDTPLIPIHGDLHIGQILRSQASARLSVTDFDGNPVLSAAERTLPQPAAVDVAGMLQSLENVGHVVVHRTSGVDPAAVRTLCVRAQTAFLDTYRATIARGGPWLLDESLIAPLRVRQVCREYLYASKHLPRWSYVPDAALGLLVRPEA